MARRPTEGRESPTETFTAHAPIVVAPRRTTPSARWMQPVVLERRSAPPPIGRRPGRVRPPRRPRSGGAAIAPRGRLRRARRAARTTAPRYARSEPRSGAWRVTGTWAAAPRDGQPSAIGQASHRGARERQTDAAELHGGVRPVGDSVIATHGGQGIGHALEVDRTIGHGEPADQPAAHVGVDHADRPAEGERGNGTGRVRPDRREPLEAVHRLGPAVPRDGRRGALQRQRATVVPEPAPLGEELRRRGAGERGRRRIACEEAREAARRSGRPASAGASPRSPARRRDRSGRAREGAMLAVVPGEERGADAPDRSRCAGSGHRREGSIAPVAHRHRPGSVCGARVR